MKYPSLGDFITQNIRYQQHWNKKVIGITDAKWQPLKDNTYIDGKLFAAGSMFKVFETTNFGWVVFDKEAKLISGYPPDKRIFKY